MFQAQNWDEPGEPTSARMQLKRVTKSNFRLSHQDIQANKSRLVEISITSNELPVFTIDQKQLRMGDL